MKRPLTVNLTVITLLLLSLVMGGFAAARQFGLLNSGLAERAQMLRNMPGGATPRLRPTFQAGEEPNFQPDDGQTFQPPADGSGATRPRRMLGILGGLLRYQNWIALGLGVLGLLAAFFVWRPLRGKSVLVVLVALGAVLLNLPALLSLVLVARFPALWLSVAPALGQIALAVLALVLALLPATRAFRGAAAAAPAEPQERVVR